MKDIRQHDRDRVRKLIALLDSDNDGEALNALRAAQRILKEHGLKIVDYIVFAEDHATKSKASPSAPSAQQCNTYPHGPGGFGSGGASPFTPYEQAQAYSWNRAANAQGQQSPFHRSMDAYPSPPEIKIADREKKKRGLFSFT